MKNNFKNGIDFLPKSVGTFDEIERIKQDCYDAIMKDPAFLKELAKKGVAIEEIMPNISLLDSYHEDFNTCKKCPGFAKCPKKDAHYQIGITRISGYLERTVGPCKLVLDDLEAQSVFIRRDMPREFQDRKKVRLAVLGKEDGLETAMLQYMCMQMKGIIQGKSSWLYISNGTIAKRSFYLSCLANSFAFEGKATRQVAFCETANLIAELRDLSIQDKKKFAQQMQALSNVPLLIFNNFGNEYKTDFAFSTILYPILQHRAMKQLPTVFGSDFSISEIRDMYASQVAPARAQQLASIIKNQSSKTIKLSGLAVF